MSASMSGPASDTSPSQTWGALALLGPPNAGKSSLLNALAGKPLAGVTHKAQTTRRQQRVIVAHGATQLVFMDTPGYLAPPRRLARPLLEEAKGACADADGVCFVLDGALPLAHNMRMLRALLAQFPPAAAPAFLLLNKLDKCAPASVLAALDALKEAHAFRALVPVSARRGTGLAQLPPLLAGVCTRRGWRYAAGQATDWSEELRACETTRMVLLRRLHEELPYGLRVVPQSWKARKGALVIEQTILVPEARQRAMVLGRNGQAIKAISMAARRAMEAGLEHKVHLFLRVELDKRMAADAPRPARARPKRAPAPS